MLVRKWIRLIKIKIILLEKIETASAVAEENSASSEEILASSQEMSASSNEVATSAEMLTGMANSMRQDVNKFILKN